MAKRVVVGDSYYRQFLAAIHLMRVMSADTTVLKRVKSMRIVRAIGLPCYRVGQSIFKAWFQAIDLASSAYEEARVRSPTLFPIVRPKTINLLVTDFCNSHCQMCRIWERKRTNELSPSQIGAILGDRLFRNVKYIGLSGGEPTLRSDLGQCMASIVKALPNLQGAGMITNAIVTDQVIERCFQLADVCKEAGVDFNVMVSMDGIGAMHDKVRGRVGNYASALQVLNHLRLRNDIRVSAGCTVVNDNVYGIEDVYYFFKEKGIPCCFRIAEHIERLGNTGDTNVIRCFDNRQRYYLSIFFFKLLQETQNAGQKRIYLNIFHMLNRTAVRRMGCNYLGSAMTLCAHGELFFCAPHSKILGNAGKTAAQTLAYRGKAEAKRIHETHCHNCIHDYSGPDLLGTKISEYLLRKQYLFPLKAIVKQASKQVLGKAAESSVHKHFLIIGWYGTETTGDKAILRSILDGCRTRQATATFTVASLYPFITHQTLREIGYPDVRVIEVRHDALLEEIRRSDCVMVGGGPLMHQIGAMGYLLWCFIEARRLGKDTWIEGCGIGPILGLEWESAVVALLKLATRIRLRDSDSVRWAVEHAGRGDAICTGDPAVDYVLAWRKRNCMSAKDRVLRCYLREWEREYSGGMGRDEYLCRRAQFENGLVALVKYLATRERLKVELWPMHTFAIGCDDREFARRFAQQSLPELECSVMTDHYAPDNILASMASASLCLCMRFHSVLFARTLDVPFIAIDYTRGGKIEGALRDSGQLANRLIFDCIADNRWREQTDAALSHIHGT